MAKPNWKDKVWPMVLHGDGCIFTRKNENSVLVVSCKSLISENSSGNVIPGFALPKHIRLSGHEDVALDLWDAYVHGLNSAFDGIHSKYDHLGIPWEEGSPQWELEGQQLCDGEVHVVVFL